MHGKGHGRKGAQSTAGLRGRVWIDGGEGTFLGYGRIVLLEKIQEIGSITKAAKAMEISYRHAWKLVDSMNRQAGHPLVESSAGGKNGGGARLTEEGEKAISLFWKLYDDFQQFLRQEEGKLGVSFKKQGDHSKDTSGSLKFFASSTATSRERRRR
ncbi:MAG TPA: winged helix-turn-helix domain-containing protein [Thermodesulfovibrionales bacterium]|nr:winged helix-turn-helix domain-containing protein [Thermodesulfovibrionales bacterium]